MNKLSTLFNLPKPIITVELPFPPSCLNPNGKSNKNKDSKGRWKNAHWSEKAKAIKDQRWECRICFLGAFGKVLNKKDFKPFKAAVIRKVFYFSKKRGRDKDTFDAMTKSTTDSLVPVNKKRKLVGCGLLIDDDQITWIPSKFVMCDRDYIEYVFYYLGDETFDD